MLNDKNNNDNSNLENLFDKNEIDFSSEPDETD